MRFWNVFCTFTLSTNNKYYNNLKTTIMKATKIQNRVTLKTTHKNGELREAVLISDSRKVEIYKGKKSGLWCVSLEKITIDSSGFEDIKTLRTYTNKTELFALGYFDKKQIELGFFK